VRKINSVENTHDARSHLILSFPIERDAEKYERKKQEDAERWT
jgi:hypothetical protein